MGKGDKKSRRGKIILGTFGVRRLRKKASGSSVSPSAASAEKPVEKKKSTAPVVENPSVPPAEVKETKAVKETRALKEVKAAKESKKTGTEKKAAKAKASKPAKEAASKTDLAETGKDEK